MGDFSIGLSGLQVAQRALDIIGTNLANAGTEGYHRQEPVIASVSLGTAAGDTLGGSRVAQTRRQIDALLESELLRQQPRLSQNSLELETLRLVEGALGDLDSDGLMSALNGFFRALTELASQPDSQALQEQAVWAGDALARHFQALGEFLRGLDAQIRLETNSATDRVNALTAQIASLNDQVQVKTGLGTSPNLLLDQRDQAIADLSELIEVHVAATGDGSGMVNVSTRGTPLVFRTSATELEVGATGDGKLAVSPAGARAYATDLGGGRLAGLLNLKNNILDEIQDKLTALAREIASAINAHHVQGVGSGGSFTQLTGWAVTAGKLSTWEAWGAHLNAGTIHVRVTDRTAGTVTAHALSVTAGDTAATIAARLDALAGLSASVADSTLRIGVEDPARYAFDFLPAPIVTPQAGWSGSAGASVAGIHAGDDNKLYTCTVTGGGTVGLTPGLGVEVRNQAGELVRTLDLGPGYAAGDRLDLAGGLRISFTPGSLTKGEQFSVTGLARSDTSGFLAAAGINTFFQGDSLLTLAVADRLLADPARLAVAAGAELTDNVNIRRMADVGQRQLAALGGLSPTDSGRMVMTNLGHQISFRQSRQQGLEDLMQHLLDQREEASGVDVNVEAGRMLMFEQMFQAMAKFINVQQAAMQTLMELL